MSGHDPEFDVWGEAGLRANVAEINTAVNTVTKLTEKMAGQLRQITQEQQKKSEADAKSHQQRMSKILDASIKQQERRDKGRLDRLATRQKAEQRQAEQQQKTADKAAENQQRQHDRLMLNLQQHSLKGQRALQREETWERNEEVKRRNKLELQATKARDSKLAASARDAARLRVVQEQRTTAAMGAEQKARLSQQEAAQDRSLARHKAFWSITRGLVETSTRFMSSSIQAYYARRFARQQSAESAEVNSLRSSEERKQGILRSSYATQERTISRSLVRQEGAIATFQTTTQRGILGSFLNMRNILLGAGGFITARAIFGPVADYQQTNLAFEALLGSSRKAERFLSQLRNFAEVTPFQFTGLAESSRMLLGIGFAARDIIPALTDIGGVASTLGASEDDIQGVIRALGQMLGQGKANAEDINQITERFVGFNARAAIAEHLGISVGEAMEQMRAGTIPADVAVEGLLEGMRNFPGAAGAMERQSRTLNGRISTLKDTVTNLLIDGLSPMIPVLAGLVGVFTDLLASLAHGEGVWEVVRSGLLGIAVGLGAIIAVRSAVQVLQFLKIALFGLTSPLALASLAFAALGATLFILYRHVPAVRQFFDELRDGLGRAAGVLADSGPALMDALHDLIDGDFAGFGVHVGDVAERVWAQIAPTVGPVYNVVRDFLVDAFDRGRDWLESDAPIELIAGLTAGFAVVRAQVGGFFAGLFGGEAAAGGAGGAAAGAGISAWVSANIVPALAGIGATLAVAFSGIDWAKVGMAILEGLRRVGEFIGGPVIEKLLSKPVLLALAAVAAGLAAAAGALALGLVQGLARSLPNAVRGLRELLDQLLGKLSDFVKDTPIGPIVDALVDQLGRVFDLVVDTLDFAGALIDAITGRGDWGEVGKAALTMLLDGLQLFFFPRIGPAILGGLGRLGDLLSDWISDATGSVEGPLGGLLKVFTAPFEFMVGTIGDLLDRVGDIISGFVDVIGGIVHGDWRRVVHGFSTIFGGLIGLFRDIFTRLWNLISDTLAGIGTFLWGSMRDGFHFVSQNIRGWLGNIVDFFRNLPGRLVRAIVGIGQAVWGFMGRAFDWVLEAARNKFRDFKSWLGDWASNLGEGIFDNWEENFNFGNKGGGSRSGGGKPGTPITPTGGPGGGGPIGGFSDEMVGQAGALPDRMATASQPGFERWTQQIQDSLTAILLGFGIWAGSVERVLTDVLGDFRKWGDTMVLTSSTIADRIVNALTDRLSRGANQVGNIVSGYVRRLVNAINPLLSAIGENTVNVPASSGGGNIFTFAQGGVMPPMMARPSDGPIVHVFNEGRSGGGSTHGEAYIPFDPGMKGQSRNLTDRVVQRLGGRVQWFREGGVTGGTIAPGVSLPNLSGDIVGLVGEFAKRLSMWATSRGQNFHVESGLRSYAEQVVLYQKYLAGTGNLAAVPGTSMHELGLAVDGPHWGGFNPELYKVHYNVEGEPWHAEPIEGKGLSTDGFTAFNPLPEPPNAGGHGKLSLVARKVMGYLYDKALNAMGQLSGPGAAGVDMGSFSASPAIMSAIRQAMGIVGVPASWLGPLLTLISRESGFNPNAYNGVLGASGLMQTIPSTFAAYHLEPYGNIFGALDNVIAGLRYILSRYGTIFNVGQATAPNPTNGYYSGGIITGDGLYRAGEYGRREMVLPIDSPRKTASILMSTGVAAAIGEALGIGPISRPDLSPRRSRGAAAHKVDLTLRIEGGESVDPGLYEALSDSAREGVAEGYARSMAVQDRW